MTPAAAVLAILGLGLAALTAWGLRSARETEAYFAASRIAGPVMAGLAGTAAGLSAFVFVGGPGLFLSVGAASLWIVLSAPLTGALQCWLVGEPVVRRARTAGLLTVPDLMADRFGEGTPRALAAVAILLGTVSMLAVQARAAALLGPPLFGVPGWIAALAITAATVSYTAAGGMRAGLPVEAAQGLLMGMAALAIAGAALVSAGGPAAAWSILAERSPRHLTAWGTVGPLQCLGWLLLFGIGTCAQPHYIQKFLMLRRPQSLRWLPLVGTLSLAAVLTVWAALGFFGSALAASGGVHPSTPDALSPAVLASILPRWAGLAAAAAVAAAVMSTASSLLNIAAAAITRDLPRAAGRPPLALGYARTATVAVALAAAGVGLLWPRALALLGALGWGTFTAALLPAVVLGLNWRGARRRGAVAAMACGPAVQLGLEAARPSIPALSAWEPGLTGAALATLLLVGLSRPGERR